MEDTKSLLIMVLHKIFHDRPKTVEETYQLIYNYNSGKRESAEYEKTLKTICDLMNDELPSEILVYLLTLVDMPQENENRPPIIEKIQKTYSCLSKSVRPTLLDYLSNKKSGNSLLSNSGTSSFEEENADSVKTDSKVTTEENLGNNDPQDGIKESPCCSSTNKKSPKKVVPRTRSRRKLKNSGTKSLSSEENDSLGTLQDIAAHYVIKHQQRLKCIYKSKLGQAWKLINSNAVNEEELKKCYRTVEDLNKKSKLLRCIENDNITDDLFLKDNDILLRDAIPDKDPFELSPNILNRLKNFLNH